MLSNKILLVAAYGGAVQSWLGNVECELVEGGEPSLTFMYASSGSPTGGFGTLHPDRKSTRLNSSHP